MDKESINKWTLLLLVFFISAIFLAMIRQFLMAILLAGIFSALSYPLFSRLKTRLGGRPGLASVVTVLIIFFGVLLPLGALVGVVTGQAIKVGAAVTPWVQRQLAQPDVISDAFRALPFFDEVAPYRDLILEKAGTLVGGISNFLLSHLQAFTMETFNFLFMLFTMLYTMFFFLIDGQKLIDKILYYLPLEDQDERRMLDKFTSVTRATIKGTAVIGILQGCVGGVAFAVVGIPSAIFWGTIMAVLSVVPGIGTALVWGPAVIFLAATGALTKAIGVLVVCGAIGGSLDNLLRPILMGKDTQMHELLIFFGTLGGITMFGILGLIIGPLVAALFATAWDLYGIGFRKALPAVGKTNPAVDGKGAETELSDEPVSEIDNER